MKENNHLSEIIERTALVMQDLHIEEVDAFDSRLAQLAPERYIEEIETLLQNVPLERRKFTKRFLDNRRQVGLMKQISKS